MVHENSSSVQIRGVGNKALDSGKGSPDLGSERAGGV